MTWHVIIVALKSLVKLYFRCLVACCFSCVCDTNTWDLRGTVKAPFLSPTPGNESESQHQLQQDNNMFSYQWNVTQWMLVLSPSCVNKQSHNMSTHWDFRKQLTTVAACLPPVDVRCQVLLSRDCQVHPLQIHPVCCLGGRPRLSRGAGGLLSLSGCDTDPLFGFRDEVWLKQLLFCS